MVFLWLGVTRLTAAGDDPLSYFSEVEPILWEHCADCHIDGAKGNVSFEGLESLESLLEKSDVWRKLKEAVAFGDMPPEPEKTGFAREDADRLVSWVESKIETIDPSRPLYQNPGPPTPRQLTVYEYDRTVKDLLGITISASSLAGIRSRPPVHGFENAAGGLNMEPSLLDKYIVVSEETVGQFFGTPKWQIGGRDSRRKQLEQEAEAARDRLLGDIEPTSAGARRFLSALLARAFRRPMDQAEVDRYHSVAVQALEAGEPFEKALEAAMIPMLVSPHFLYRLEKDRPGEMGPYRIGPHELAVRLSYFLWASMPDEELFRLAESGELLEPDVLRAQTLRMLSDPRAESLNDHFAGVWWGSHKIWDAPLDRSQYPEFYKYRTDMRREMHALFDYLRRQDRSVMELLQSDYVVTNEALGKTIYGLESVEGNHFQAVHLPEGHARGGGLLGSAGFLTLTSHSDRTKPTARGEWILDVILGTPPSPPPADAGNFRPKKDEPEPKTFREKLAQHAADPNCAGCHKKIDPLGFALENFDPIGRWREEVSGGAVDNQGELPTGEKLDGVEGLRTVLMAREELFARNVARRLLEYALGREPEYFDEAAVRKIVAGAEVSGHRLSAYVLGVVQSHPFQHRINLGQGEPVAALK